MSFATAVLTIGRRLIISACSATSTTSSLAWFAHFAVLCVDSEVSLLDTVGKLMILAANAAERLSWILLDGLVGKVGVLHEVQPVVLQEFVGELKDANLAGLWSELITTEQVDQIVRACVCS